MARLMIPCSSVMLIAFISVSRIPDVLSFGTRPRKLRRSRQLGFPELRKIMNRVVAWPQLNVCCWCSWCVWVFDKLDFSWLQRILMCQFKNSARFPKIFTQDFKFNPIPVVTVQTSNSGLMNPYFSGIRAQSIFCL